MILRSVETKLGTSVSVTVIAISIPNGLPLRLSVIILLLSRYASRSNRLYLFLAEACRKCLLGTEKSTLALSAASVNVYIRSRGDSDSLLPLA